MSASVSRISSNSSFRHKETEEKLNLEKLVDVINIFESAEREIYGTDAVPEGEFEVPQENEVLSEELDLPVAGSLKKKSSFASGAGGSNK
jgi:hypothetical protein